MSIYAKDNNPYYYYTIKLDGVRRTFSSKIPKKLKFKHKVIVKQQEHQARVDQRGSFEEHTYDDLLRRLEGRYGRSDKRNLRYFKRYFKHRALSSLREDELNGLVDRHAKTRNNATTNRVFTTLRAALKIAKKELGWLSYVPEIKKLKEAPRLGRVLSAEQELKLLIHAPPHLQIMIRFVLQTGFRAGMLVKLTWDMVDWERRLIRIPAKIMKNRYPREINLNNEALKILNEIPVGGIYPQIFKYQGRPISNPATTAWQRTRAKAGINNFRFHDLRHTWATRLREQGVPDRIIVHLGGWCSSQMLNYYSRQSKVDVSNIEGYV